MRKIMFFLSLSAIILSFHPQSLQAEPSSLVRLLMNENVSLFDAGLLRLEEDLNKDSWYKALTGTKGQPSASVDYEWEKNRIEILFRYTLSKEYRDELKKYYHENQARMKEALKDAYQIPEKEPDVFLLLKEEIMSTIDMIKGLKFGVKTKRNSFMLVFEGLGILGSYFQHKGGYKVRNQPENFAKDLESLVDIKTIVMYMEGDKQPFKFPIQCMTSLTSDEYYWKE